MKALIILASIVIVLLLVLGISQFLLLRKAHSSFENYYDFRGCRELLQKADTYGVCRTDSGKIIKIVEFNGAWYLDGDLPTCFGGFCFGI
ncbi:MAG: hypothetical protein KGJ13_02910 [Patescibacteria group bacterium]|nr:hypothetical protein [Patescibacteria group bacterium]